MRMRARDVRRLRGIAIFGHFVVEKRGQLVAKWSSRRQDGSLAHRAAQGRCIGTGGRLNAEAPPGEAAHWPRPMIAEALGFSVIPVRPRPVGAHYSSSHCPIT